LTQNELSTFLLAKRKNQTHNINSFNPNLQKKISYILSPTDDYNAMDSIEPEEELQIVQKVKQKLMQSSSFSPKSISNQNFYEVNPRLKKKERSKLDEAPRLNFFRLNFFGK
jgi:hypothetical protein